jgi:Ca2+-binding RTX toxin-like protein
MVSARNLWGVTMPTTAQPSLATLADFALAAYHLGTWEPVAAGLNDVNPAAAGAYSSLVTPGGWQALTASALVTLPSAPTTATGAFQSGLQVGIYMNGNAAALIARGGDTLVLSFRGTNDNGSAGILDLISILSGYGTPDEDHWADIDGPFSDQGMGDHYALFADLISALDAYIANPNNGIAHVYVTGHSLGAAMVNAYMDAHANTASVTFEAVTFADPGYFTFDLDSRITNFVNDTDFINVPGLLGATPGDDNTLNDDLFAPFDTHSMQLYDQVLHFLHDEGVPDTNIFDDGNPATRNFGNFIYHIDDVSGIFTIGIGNNVLTGGTGSDVVLGGGGDDTLEGGAADDWLLGGAGIDLLYGGMGADQLTGGADNDLLRGGAGADQLYGGFGIDTADYSHDAGLGGTAGIYVDLLNGFAQDGFGAYDTLVSIEAIYGSDRDRVAGVLGDVLIGDNNANVIHGLGGLDYIVGNGGDDIILTYNGQAGGTGDIVVAGSGNDTVYGGSGATFIYGNDGSDVISGGTGDDWLFGGDFAGTATGTDTIYGGDGIDVIAVGSAGGNALMYGGSGNDTIYGGSGAAGNDTITGGTGWDFMYGAEGNDTYRFDANDLVSGDFDQIYGFNAGDALSFAAAYNSQIGGQQLTLNGISGSYLSSTSGWALWMPYTTWTSVQTQILYV